MLSTSGVIVAAAAFVHRDDRAWQRSLPLIMWIALVQVVFGAVALAVLR
jgi:exosortase/archaeosortase